MSFKTHLGPTPVSTSTTPSAIPVIDLSHVHYRSSLLPHSSWDDPVKQGSGHVPYLFRTFQWLLVSFRVKARVLTMASVAVWICPWAPLWPPHLLPFPTPLLQLHRAPHWSPSPPSRCTLQSLCTTLPSSWRRHSCSNIHAPVSLPECLCSHILISGAPQTPLYQ